MTLPSTPGEVEGRRDSTSKETDNDQTHWDRHGPTYREEDSLPGDRKQALISAAREAAQGFEARQLPRYRTVETPAGDIAAVVYHDSTGFALEVVND